MTGAASLRIKFVKLTLAGVIAVGLLAALMYEQQDHSPIVCSAPAATHGHPESNGFVRLPPGVHEPDEHCYHEGN